MRLGVLTLSVLSLLAGCGAEGTVKSAHFVDSITRVQVEYRLVGAHPYLAEFDRTFRIAFSRSQREFPLEMDTGGYLLMNVYRLPDHRLLFDDGADYVIVDCERETVEQTQAEPARPTEYLGCFDHTSGGTLQFIPAAQRPEQRPSSRRTDGGT